MHSPSPRCGVTRQAKPMMVITSYLAPSAAHLSGCSTSKKKLKRVITGWERWTLYY